MPHTRQTVFIERHHKFHMVGSAAGGMGKVYFLDPEQYENIQRSPLNRTYYPFSGPIAAKFPKSLSDSEAFERECRIWLELRHRHIVPLLRLTPIGGQMAALMPRFSHSLEDLIRAKPNVDFERDNYWYSQLIGLCDGLDYAWRKKGLLHLDLKPQNILNYHKNGTPYLSIADWGMARFQDHCFWIKRKNNKEKADISSLAEYGGTLPYMSPDRILGAMGANSYIHDVTDDIFSLGIIMIEIATQTNPCIQACTSQEELVKNMISGKYFLSVEKALNRRPSPFALLASECCHPDKSKRPKNYKSIITRAKNHVV